MCHQVLLYCLSDEQVSDILEMTKTKSRATGVVSILTLDNTEATEVTLYVHEAINASVRATVAIAVDEMRSKH